MSEQPNYCPQCHCEDFQTMMLYCKTYSCIYCGKTWTDKDRDSDPEAHKLLNGASDVLDAISVMNEAMEKYPRDPNQGVVTLSKECIEAMENHLVGNSDSTDYYALMGIKKPSWFKRFRAKIRGKK